jgi:hypothetical protein
MYLIKQKSFFLILILLLLSFNFVQANESCEDSSCEPPQVVSLNPEPGLSGADLNSAFIMEFDKTVRLDRGFINVRNYEDDTLIASFDVKSIFVDSSLNQVFINPDFDFSGFSRFYIEVTNEAIIDNDGNHFEGISDKSWNFEGVDFEIQNIIDGIQIDAPLTRNYEGAGFVRFDYSLKRSDNNNREVCAIRYNGIRKKTQRYLFPIGSKEILTRFKLRRKQIRRLRRQAERHTVTILMECTDGSSDSQDVVISL